MELFIIVGVIILAFICEYIDSSLGMGYGTILTPILIIVDFKIILVIPSVLFSQALASSSAAIFHWKYGNVDLDIKEGDVKIIFIIVALGLIGITLASLISLRMPQVYMEVYLGVILVAMGVILLRTRKFIFSLLKFSFVGVLGAFNKAFTGAGFGPVLTSGQIISGKKSRTSIGVTTVAEAPICIFSFVAFVLFNGFEDYLLLILLSIGALMATPFGPYRTTKLRETNGRIMIGILTIGLGIFILVKNLIWPDIMEIIVNPFFWAMIGMFALIGASVTLVSKQLGQYPRLNIALVALFGFCRFILVLPFVQQPRFEIEVWHLAVGAAMFLVGLVFLIPLLQINPFPVPDEPKNLVTTGFYSIVRNPIYLGEIMWSLGWAMMFGSVVGIALVPLWWGGLLFHVFLEEEDLERKLDGKYLEYKERVTGRIFPGLPI